MKVRKNSRPSIDPDCDHCRQQSKNGVGRRASTHRVQVGVHCIWMWLCDEHTSDQVAHDFAWTASHGVGQ